MKRVALGLMLSLLILVGLAGCRWAISGQLQGRRVFTPLLGHAAAYLRLDLSTAGQSGGLLVHFVDLLGQRVALKLIPLPSARPFWGWDLGDEATVDGRPFYALKIEPLGSLVKPLSFTFHPFGGLRHGPRGLFKPPGSG